MSYPVSHETSKESRAPATVADAMGALGGIIILLVLVGSYTTRYQAAIGHSIGMAWFPAVGFVALQLFLARSAYRLLDEVRGFAGVAAYAKARALRYLPAVIPSVLFAFLIGKTVGLPGFRADFSSLPANVLMLADVFGVSEVDAAHYRLKIELILSVFVGLLWFSRLRHYLAPVLLAVLVVATACVAGEPVRQGTLSAAGLLTADGYMPLFAFGLALNHIVRDPAPRIWWAIAAVAAALVFVSNTLAHGIIVLGALAFLAAIVAGRLNGLGRSRALVLLGELAFPIYVVHLTLGFAVISKLEAAGVHPVHAMIIAAVVAIGAGKLINLVFERRAEAYVAFVWNTLAKGKSRLAFAR